MNESASDGDDCRTAPATQGLLTIMFLIMFFLALYRLNTTKYNVYIYIFISSHHLSTFEETPSHSTNVLVSVNDPLT